MQQRCLNCSEIIPVSASFCPSCGQAKATVDMKVSSIFAAFFNTLFNVDSKLWSTLKQILYPSRLALAFTEGRRKSYLHPIRLFIGLLFMLSLLIIFIDTGLVLNIESFSKDRIEQDKDYHRIDSILNRINVISEAQKDSILCIYFDSQMEQDTSYFGEGQSVLGVALDSFKISERDAYEMKPKDIFEKYGIDKLSDKLLLNPVLKMSKDPASGIRSLGGNMLWVILFQSFLAAFWMKLLLMHRVYYYAEHLVLIIYGHCTVVILLIFAFILSRLVSDSLIHNVIISILLIITPIIQYKSIRRYYKLGKLQTIVLWLVFNMGYLMLLLVSILIVWFVSLNIIR